MQNLYHVKKIDTYIYTHNRLIAAILFPCRLTLTINDAASFHDQLMEGIKLDPSRARECFDIWWSHQSSFDFKCYM
jgi:hypothetical protein